MCHGWGKECGGWNVAVKNLAYLKLATSYFYIENINLFYLVDGSVDFFLYSRNFENKIREGIFIKYHSLEIISVVHNGWKHVIVIIILSK